ncbi:MAG: TonB-dependent receptor [Ignavibacteriales bacterium]|nr:TonB-dependent receptor [Ignavibacteriales bacterium]
MAKTIVLCVLLSFCAFAQDAGKISGRILDAKSKESLPAANITVRGTSLGASSDPDGNYFILNVPPGVYNVAASLIGYRGIVQQRIIVNMSRTTTVDFLMEETAVQSQEVVVTATRPDVEREKSSTSEIRRGEDVVNVPGIQDISDVLALNADVSDGHFRGGRDNEELYNLHGMGIMNPLTSASSFNPIMSAVEEVEIITSGFSAQYGNAQSGIVNITMKEGAGDKWSARGELRTRLPSMKHFGPSLWDTVNNPYLAMRLTLDKWKGNEGTVSGRYGGYASTAPSRAALLYTNWLMQAHRTFGESYDNLRDYSLDANLGGPLAKNIRMFLAVHTDNSWPILPTPEPNLSRQFMGNLVFDVGSAMSLRMSGAYSRADGHVFSDKSGVGWYDWVWDQVFNINRTINENTQLGLRWSHALSKSTFYEFKLNSLRTSSIEGPPATDPNEDYYNPPFPVWDQAWDGKDVGDYFKYGQLNSSFTSEKTRTISIDASMTSQVSLSHMLLAGVQGNWYALEVDDLFGAGGKNTSISQYTVKPYEYAFYVQDKMEFQGMIANVGLRLDVYNANVQYYTDIFSPYRYIDSLGSTKFSEALAPKSKTPTVTGLQPRVGISFPVSVTTVFHVNYGTFLQRPPFNRIINQRFSRFDISTGTITQIPSLLGNPTLKPEMTNSYDVGVTQGLGEGFTLDISGYYKDVRNLIQQAQYHPTSGAPYVTYVNRDYADIRGFRAGFSKRSGILSGSLNYTFGVATGKNSSALGLLYPDIYESGVTKDPTPEDIYLDFDRTHNLVANLIFNTPLSWGPELFGAYPLEQFTIAATSFARSGRPYNSQINKLVLMGLRAPAEYNVNVKITKQMSDFFGTSASFYAEVTNLFNNRIYDYNALFNPNTAAGLGLEEYTKKFELGEDVTYFTHPDSPSYLVNQEFRLYSNAPRSVQVGMIINL